MSQPQTTYEGETKKRSKFVATLLTFLCPGLGYMYVGQLYKGISINFAFLIMVESFVITFTILKFFPLLPALVILFSWFVFTLFALRSVLNYTEKSRNYVLKGFNHWVLYSLVFLFTFALPLYLTKHFVSEYAIEFQTMENDGMLPALRAGDTVLIDKGSFIRRDPQLGELVWVQLNNGKRSILRVVGVSEDTVKIESESVFVNEKHLVTKGFETKGKIKKGLLAMVEENRDSTYLISSSPDAYNEVNIPPIKIADDHLFLLADNRSQIGDGKIRDSRDFGTVSKNQILGKPLYISWSTEKTVLWDRIGLALR